MSWLSDWPPLLLLPGDGFKSIKVGQVWYTEICLVTVATWPFFFVLFVPLHPHGDHLHLSPSCPVEVGLRNPGEFAPWLLRLAPSAGKLCHGHTTTDTGRSYSLGEGQWSWSSSLQAPATRAMIVETHTLECRVDESWGAREAGEEGSLTLRVHYKRFSRLRNGHHLVRIDQKFV